MKGRLGDKAIGTLFGNNSILYFNKTVTLNRFTSLVLLHFQTVLVFWNEQVI